jgi:lipopolysaccharide/colanic/teichoic acid biosynthesis glycosyltransferase
MFLIAIGILVTSKGPMIYRAPRIGYKGKPFYIYKFRTMYVNADASPAFITSVVTDKANSSKPQNFMFKLQKDSRITPFGGLLRKFSLDELPSVFNVAKGDLSIVGPRPAQPSEVRNYSEWEKRRLDTKPGITGLWQVLQWGELNWDSMMELDLVYMENRSFWLDLKIITRALIVTLTTRASS